MKIKCPSCKTKINWEGNKWRPFCSERCKMIDLGGWATEKFKVSQQGMFDESEQEIIKFNDQID